jgi:hypothetical protein
MELQLLARRGQAPTLHGGFGVELGETMLAFDHVAVEAVGRH